jgi:hypothetical protein
MLAVFLTEKSLEAWRKHASISLEEEAYSKRVDRVEEMSIPSDLEDKLAYVHFYVLRYFDVISSSILTVLCVVS